MKIGAMRITTCLLAVTVLAGCTTSVPGTPESRPVVGTMTSGGGLDVTLVSFVDPAPLYQADEYDSKPQDGDHLVAAQLRIHNTGDRDYLVDPITEASVLAAGQEFDTSLAATSAGVMLDQVSLSPGQTVLGYVTFDVPEQVRTTQVRFEPNHGAAMLWQVGPNGKPHPPVPWPDARKSVHRMGEQATITSEGRQLIVAPTKLTDPAPAQAQVDAGMGQHVVQVDFTVFANTGPTTDDPSLRIMTIYDNADQPVNAHIYSMEASVERPLTVGEQTTWPVQFVVPDGFVPDHISFRPEFGRTTTTSWALS
ncbi:DUF4352 domain-containing protein [Labedaea rhizosphaerae]|uniref:Uncharacterized protein DUF4352 n=1 Tax=Labedaea rhizosphaerae TaxID=598644 RepID=A0A4R6SJT9_LABRH|nr:DUF4352 domain-containing protein [Labedaea rhizosphaerae]TDQ04111.1 uncharacterized protein DUF4352 [Labedaea rhizosphaerae]